LIKEMKKLMEKLIKEEDEELVLVERGFVWVFYYFECVNVDF
jgi:hypothetical protein